MPFGEPNLELGREMYERFVVALKEAVGYEAGPWSGVDPKVQVAWAMLADQYRDAEFN